MAELQVGNLLAWMAQTVLVASVGAVLPLVFRLRHPRTQLAYSHLVLAVCLLLPLFEPWRHGPGPRPVYPVVWWALAAGVTARIVWLLGGLWQIRKYRIAATPLYPVPESVAAASAITHAGAVFCISSDTPGPVMLGWLNPVVLLPESFPALGEEAQCGIVCHELLHVRRHDWLATLLEELAGALLWFNPGAWLLLAETRLAREQLVDGETVRLTAAAEPYIEALLAIARRRPTLDLAPAPLFLRRRHLTQRMHALLHEASMSKLRLLSSYCSIAAILAFAGWFACGWFPLTGRPAAERPAARGMAAARSLAAQAPPAADSRDPVLLAFQARRGRPAGMMEPRPGSAPIPVDPHEPVTGQALTAATADARAAALSLLERARQNSVLHLPGTSPFQLDAKFTASGNAAYLGPGELTETWLSGRSWRWTASLGNFSLVRIGLNGVTAEDQHVAAVPMRVHMLRNAIFWASQQTPSNFLIRTAAVELDSRPATCLLVSGVAVPAAQSRLWEEEEYCVDSASGLLLEHSIAPGTYAAYSYRSEQFHGRYMPQRITIYVAGAMALDAQVSMTDPTVVDSQLRPTPEMLANGPVMPMEMATRFPINFPSSSATGTALPVIVHASVDGEGRVAEEEISSASDPGLARTALDLVRNYRFPASGAQRQAYINVRFVPESQ
ncbi:MAG: M56 family metallopeptidase [Acidobacteriia bacterium]|nr:M56 family metallopeptidase [Terriglobia bacterium]